MSPVGMTRSGDDDGGELDGPGSQQGALHDFGVGAVGNHAADGGDHQDFGRLASLSPGAASPRRSGRR